VAGQFVSRVFVVLLRKRFPQNHNLQTAAVLSVMWVHQFELVQLPMKIKTSYITASILRDLCNVSNELVEQIDGLPVKASTVYLQVEQAEMKRAAIALKEVMSSSNSYHKDTFESVLKEIEYFANHST
jgi:hypothetical protein